MIHPILTDRRRLALYLVVWVNVGVLLAFFLRALGPLSWHACFALALPLALFYGFVCLSTYYVGRRAFPLQQADLARAVGTVVAAGLVSATLWVLTGRLLVELLAWLGVPLSRQPGATATAVYLPIAPLLFVVGLLLFLLASVVHHLVLALEASRQAETRALEFQVLSRDAELRALRAQLHPHFLFNSLNSISALITSRPEEARRTCLGLGDLLRKSLALGARERVALSEELALVEHLLTIEKARFGVRLSHAIEVPADAAECLIPALLLQPLVENAVTHGIAARVDGGTIRIEAHRSGARLSLSVENPIDPDAAVRKGTGVGLDNVRRRLAVLYGRDAFLDVRKDEHTYRVELNLPSQPALTHG